MIKFPLSMRRTLTVLGIVAISCAHAQNPYIQAAIDAVNIDSMMLDLGLLTGEAPVDIGNGPQTITSRNKNQPGNPLSALWLQQRYADMGFTPSVQVFSGGTGENILAELPGAVHPERKVIVCAHYDAMPGGPVAAPAADDDGSGTVAVIEAMRVLSQYTFENSIVFAEWDEEEQGKLGSIFYAGVAAGNDMEITGVVNMDAISYDGDGDGLMRVHTKNIANSIAIKDTAVLVNNTYAGLQLPMAINLPGATYSDHASFWSESYGAILIIEDFDNDGNPHYHTSTDLLQYIDQPYFLGLARLGIGTTAALAKPLSGPMAISPMADAREREELFAFPNPAHGLVNVRYTTEGGRTSMEVMDAMGHTVVQMAEGMLAPGRHAFQFDASALAPGAYVVRVIREGHATTFPLVRVP